ncbi:hypothetical protein [Pontibacter ruber]|uniref:Uncharacterized protein n=1 Tax=Pontibacter ruber TaxID=1343895 RepID=A0ABW5D0F6_9BACT|nr:hypothetical protein [Pontibacter ruber]
MEKDQLIIKILKYFESVHGSSNVNGIPKFSQPKELIDEAINTCIEKNYIKRAGSHTIDFQDLDLTEAGLSFLNNALVMADKNDLIDKYSSHFGNKEQEFLQFAHEHEIANAAMMVKEFQAIQHDLYSHIYEITEPNVTLTETELELASIIYLKNKYDWINSKGISALNRWLVWMCWHEGIIK